jgi:hypothetical protein
MNRNSPSTQAKLSDLLRDVSDARDRLAELVHADRDDSMEGMHTVERRDSVIAFDDPFRASPPPSSIEELEHRTKRAKLSNDKRRKMSGAIRHRPHGAAGEAGSVRIAKHWENAARQATEA